MEKVVYILGAGFSAPLNIPVMDNFLMKAKDIYFENPSKYSHFKKIFEIIKDMSFSKNYYNCDLSNIEEILSILEMQERFGDKTLKKFFIIFIADVIKHFTPSIEIKPPAISNHFLVELFSGSNEYAYASFIGNLFNLNINSTYYKSGRWDFIILKDDKLNCDYSIINLNYDMVLEIFCDLYNKLSKGKSISFTNSISSKENNNMIYLAKLHGSIEHENIVPPTWNKTIDQNIEKDWKLAFYLLKNANHIRILGYSLPETDTYIKYLLKASVVSAEHLKSIDVICLDDEKNSVKSRYDSFIEKRYYRFANKNIMKYLRLIANKSSDFIRSPSPPSMTYHPKDGKSILKFDKLEETHKQFFNE